MTCVSSGGSLSQAMKLRGWAMKASLLYNIAHQQEAIVIRIRRGTGVHKHNRCNQRCQPGTEDPVDSVRFEGRFNGKATVLKVFFGPGL